MDEAMLLFSMRTSGQLHGLYGESQGSAAKSAETAAAQDRLTGALISYAGQLVGEGRAPDPGTGPAADGRAVHHHHQREL